MKYLVGFDGSRIANAALSLARTYAEVLGATVIVVTSMGSGRIENLKSIDKVSSDLTFAEQFLKEKGVPCEIHQLARGLSYGEDLVRFAEDNDINLIFIGIEKTSKVDKLLLGSTAQHIILKAPCPVMSVNILSIV